MRAESDKALIAAILEMMEAGYPGDFETQARTIVREAGGESVSPETYRKWRTGETQRLDKRTRPKVLATLRRYGIDPKVVVSGGYDEPALKEREGSGVTREIELINALEIDEWHRTWRIAEMAALYRAAAIEQEAVAAAERARAMQIAERGALARVDAARQAAGDVDRGTAAKEREQAQQQPQAGSSASQPGGVAG